jgi:hypothetical protein
MATRSNQMKKEAKAPLVAHGTPSTVPILTENFHSNDNSDKVIIEIGLCQGYPRVLSVKVNGTQVQMDEMMQKFYAHVNRKLAEKIICFADWEAFTRAEHSLAWLDLSDGREEGGTEDGAEMGDALPDEDGIKVEDGVKTDSLTKTENDTEGEVPDAH